MEEIGLLEGDNDVTEMAKRMASRPTVQRVHMTTVQIKKLQALVWWIRDRMMHDQPLVAMAFDADALTAALERKRIEKEGTETEVKISEIMKVDPNKYEDCKDAFQNVLASKKGKYGVALSYIIRDQNVPAAFAMAAEERLYQIYAPPP